jgi:DNA-binding transcriptional MerR regulator
MEQDLISKKELLELTGISYGQLYRWKRKKLIPEDWFIRKSTFTGQETFFPKEKILARIAKIKDMKDNLSLDDLADIFSPNLAEVILKKQELLDRNVVTKIAVEIYLKEMGDTDSFTFDKILYVYVLDKLLQSGEISLEEGKSLLQTMADNYKKFEGKHCELIFIRKMGISTFLLTLSPNKIYFESSTKIVARISLASCIEELKIKLGAL